MNLYSALTECNAFSSALHNTITAAKATTILCHTSMRGSHPLPDQLPGEHTGPHHTLCSIPSNNHLQCCHTYTHSLMVDRSTVVGHIPMVHMCSFMCTNQYT